MNIEYHSWDSRHLNQKMELKVYGHGGRPLLVFPTSSGRFFDFEDRGMINLVSNWIDAGKLQIFCIDSIDPQTWDKTWASVGERMNRHEEYDRYVTEEVVPFIREKNKGGMGIICSGVSMGATHAVNFFFRHPDVFGGTLALSGLYHTRSFFGDYQGEGAYFNSPLSFLPNLSDVKVLEQCRQGKIIVCAGQGAWEDLMAQDTRELKNILETKNISAWIDLWGHDVNHDWPWWYKQFPHFISGLLNSDK
jgi:esterase/lipase superfamily enzyme